MKTIYKLLGFITSGIILVSSCVNDEYDLKKELDKEITVLKNISLPVGEIGKLSLEDIMDLKTTQNIIDIDGNGNYVLSVTGEKLSYAVDGFEFKISKSQFPTEPIIVHFPIPSSLSGTSGDLIDMTLVYSELTGSKLTASMDIQIYTDVPEEISGIRKLTVDSDINMVFTVSSGKLYLKSGFSIELPDYLHFTKVGNADYYTVSEGHIITLTKDVDFRSGAPLSLSINLDAIEIPSDSFTNGRLHLDDEVGISGDFYVRTSDFSTIPENLSVELKAEVSDIDIEAIEAKFDFNHQFDDEYFSLAGIPEFMTEDMVVLDFYNPTILYTLNNSTPLDLELSACLTSTILGSHGSYDDIFIYPFGNSTIVVPAHTENASYITSRRPVVTNSNVTNIVVPEFGQIIREIPYRIGLSDLFVRTKTTDYVTVSSDNQLSASAEYEINVPLAFGEDLAFKFDYDITGLGFKLNADIDNAILSFDIINSIPLKFALYSEAIDANGNVIEDIDMNIDYVVNPGTHLSPTTSTISIDIVNTAQQFEMNAIRLKFVASVPSDFAGITLNKSQGLEINKISIALPGGITFKLK